MLSVRLSLRSFGRLRHIQKRTLNGVSIPQHRLTVIWRKYQVLNQAKSWKGWTMSIDLDQCVSKCFSSFLKLPSLHRIHFPTSDNKLGFPSETRVHFRYWKVFFFWCFVSNMFQPRSFYGPMFAIWRIRVPHHCHCAKSSPLHPFKSLSWRIGNFPFALPSEYDRSRRQMQSMKSWMFEDKPKASQNTALFENIWLQWVCWETVLQPENKTICQDVPGWHESQDQWGGLGG